MANNQWYEFLVTIEDMELIRDVLKERLERLYVGMNKKGYDKNKERLQTLKDDIESWIENRKGNWE